MRNRSSVRARIRAASSSSLTLFMEAACAGCAAELPALFGFGGAIIDASVVAGIEDHEDLAGELAQEEGFRRGLDERSRRRDRRRLLRGQSLSSSMVAQHRRSAGQQMARPRSRTPVMVTARGNRNRHQGVLFSGRWE